MRPLWSWLPQLHTGKTERKDPMGIERIAPRLEVDGQLG